MILLVAMATYGVTKGTEFPAVFSIDIDIFPPKLIFMVISEAKTCEISVICIHGYFCDCNHGSTCGSYNHGFVCGGLSCYYGDF